MTPEQIRAECVETLAESLFLSWAKGRDIEGYVWADVEERMRLDFLDHAGVHVDALAAAGRLPTEIEYRYIGRGLLRRWRYAGPWHDPDLPDGQPAPTLTRNENV